MSYNLYEDYEAFGDTLVPQILPNGKYVATVKRAIAGQTNNGKSKIVVTLEIAEGPRAGAEVVEQLTWSPESETAARIMAGALAVMGATPEWVRTNRATFADVADHIIGAVVEISAREDEWNGQPRNRVGFLRTLQAPSAVQVQQSAVSLDTPQAAAPAAAPAAAAPSAAPQSSWPSL